MCAVASTLDSVTLDFYRSGLEAPSDAPAEPIAHFRVQASRKRRRLRRSRNTPSPLDRFMRLQPRRLDESTPLDFCCLVTAAHPIQGMPAAGPRAPLRAPARRPIAAAHGVASPLT